MRAIDCRYAARSILLPREGNIHSYRVAALAFFCFTNHNLDDFPVLSKVLVAAKCLEQVLFPTFGVQAHDVNEILLYDTKPSKMFPTQSLDVLPLALFLLGKCLFPILPLLVCFLPDDQSAQAANCARAN